MNIREFRNVIASGLKSKYPQVEIHPYIPGISFRPSIIIEQAPPIVIIIKLHESFYSLLYQLMELRLYQPKMKIILLMIIQETKSRIRRKIALKKEEQIINEFTDVFEVINSKMEFEKALELSKDAIRKLKGSMYNSAGVDLISDYFKEYQPSINAIENLLENRFPRNNYLALSILLNQDEKLILKGIIEKKSPDYSEIYDTEIYNKIKYVVGIPRRINEKEKRFDQHRSLSKTFQLLLSDEIESILKHPILERTIMKFGGRETLLDFYINNKVKNKLFPLFRELQSAIALANVIDSGYKVNTFSPKKLEDKLDKVKMEKISPAFRDLIARILKPNSFDFFTSYSTDGRNVENYYKTVTITPFPYNRASLSRILLMGFIFKTFCRKNVQFILKVAIPPYWNMGEEEERQLLSYSLELLIEAGWVVENIRGYYLQGGELNNKQ